MPTGRNGSRWLAMSFPRCSHVVWLRSFASGSLCTTSFSPHSITIVLPQSLVSPWSFIQRSRPFVSHIRVPISISVSHSLRRPLRFQPPCRASSGISGVCGAKPNQAHRFQMHSTPTSRIAALDIGSRRWCRLGVIGPARMGPGVWRKPS
jgi:hypothetical protein